MTREDLLIANVINLMFVNPCIILEFTKKVQHDATVYQNFYFIFIQGPAEIPDDLVTQL